MSGNTHYAVTISGQMEMTLVACGPRDFCREHLDEWLKQHPLGEFDSAEVLERDPANVLCRNECAVVEPFGFVPESGCSVHD